MAVFSTRIFYDITRGQAVRSLAEPVGPVPLHWTLGDTVRAVVTFVEDAGRGRGVVNVCPGTGKILQLAIGVRGGTPITSGTSGAPVEDAFTVDVPMGVAAVVSDVGAAPSIDRTLEFKTTDGAGYQRYSAPLRIHNRVSTDALADPPPADRALGVNEASALYLRMDETIAGQFRIETSPNGGRWRISRGDDGEEVKIRIT